MDSDSDDIHPTPRDIYLADREDQSQMQSASVAYLGGILAYALGLLTVLNLKEFVKLDGWVIGTLSLISVVLLGFYGQHVSMQAIRAASLVLQESRVAHPDPDIGQQVVERWNSFGSHSADKWHRRALTVSYGLGTVVLLGGVVLPLVRLAWDHGQPLTALLFGLAAGLVLILYSIAWSKVRKEAARIHGLAKHQSPPTPVGKIGSFATVVIIVLAALAWLLS